jgi:AraC-like DNA-binding protein
MTGADLRILRHQADGVVACLEGDLTSTTTAAVQKALTKLLLNHPRVLLDVSQTRLVWNPAPELFVSAVAAAGGWPLARLVLVGADRDTTDRLRACRVSESVPLAATEQDAAALLADRPSRLMRREQLPAHHSSVLRACLFVDDVCRVWDVPDATGRARSIVAELATNAVRHARTRFLVRLVLEGDRMRISVRDYRPGSPVEARTVDRADSRPSGLGVVDTLSDSWGVLRFDDGKAVWAVLDSADRAVADPHPHDDRGSQRPRPGRPPATSTARGRSVATVGPVVVDPRAAVRRQHFVTHDVERAHEFISSTYSRHTPHLVGARDSFQLEFSAVATRSFAVELVSHSLTGQARFEPCADLFVARLQSGRFRISSGSAVYETAPGDLLLVGPGVAHDVVWDAPDVEVIRLDPAAVAAIGSEISGIDAEAVRFSGARPLSRHRTRHWSSVIRALRHAVVDNDQILSSSLVQAATLRHLATTLVETFPNSALDALVHPKASAGRVEPAVLRRAVQFIDEHAGEDIGLSDIAAAARVGTRAVQTAFRRYRNETPLAHLRRVRLERAHRDLTTGDPTAGDTVAAIATRWGFAHHGYFAASYRRAYGTSPNVTLRS